MSKVEEVVSRAKQAVYPRNLWHIVMIAGAGLFVLGILTGVGIFNLFGGLLAIGGFIPTCLEATTQEAQERRERGRQQLKQKRKKRIPMNQPKPRKHANPAYAEGMRQIRSSNKAGPHKDKRTRRIRTRSAAVEKAVKDYQ